MAERKFITFLSDFGYIDDFVGTCHGVIKKIAPEVEIIDITHEIQRHHILQGAVVLANTLPYMPESVILAVVDPGVGGQRKPVAIRTARGRFLVGPDNGLLSLAANRLGGAEEAVELACTAFALPHVCKTFEGRDLFSPVAAHITRGVSFEQLGSPLPVDQLEQAQLPEPVRSKDGITARVIYVDRFGNVQLNLTPDDLASIGAKQGGFLSVLHGDEGWKVPYVETFGDVAPEEILVYEDSYGKIAFSVNQGDAGRIFQIGEGNEMHFRTA
ncbi:MAG: SAM-dependent chlorinase/fluorinase [Thermoleophilia bacterium]|nr:SAM-dependent chlorinase/fluorinase [Thermoleophilia bacterium]